MREAQRPSQDYLRQQSHMRLWTKAGQYGWAGQNAEDAKTREMASAVLLPYTTTWQQQPSANTGANQIHL